MQLLEIIDYGPKWWKFRKYYRKFPLNTQKFTKNALTGPTHRPCEKGEKNKKISADG
jgi:hypothetical protein